MGFAFPREIELDAVGVVSGDCVLVGVSRVGMSLAAVVVFGLPLILMLAAAAAAQVLWTAGAAFAAAAGLAGGGFLSLLLARRARLERWVEPILVEIRARQDVGSGR